MRIHHYTNIETLALILKNRTIRFNRLDCVDDVEEGCAESSGIQFSKYVFVSCWTENAEESIPLWKLYTSDMRGVRISMEREMFQEYILRQGDLPGVNIHEEMKFLVPPSEMMNPEYMFHLGICDYNNDLFYRKVNYVDDVREYTKDAIKINVSEQGLQDMNLQAKPFGYYKNMRWQFQEESRFVLYIVPYNIFVIGAYNPLLSTITQSRLMANTPLPFSDYYLHLKDEAFDGMEITLSPFAGDPQRIIAQSLVEKYAPNAKICESSLSGRLRLK